MKIWRFVRWPLGAVLVLYIVVVIYRIPAVGEKQRTAETVARIQAQKITLADVMGSNLPPAPDMEKNNATVAGIDANNNGIRDDVELAIFKLHPNEAHIRAAELQYALALQVEMTQVFNSETWIAAAEQDDRGYQCIGQTYPRTNLSKALSVLEARTKEIKDLVFNTQIRKTAYDKSNQYTTSFGLPNSDLCDIDLGTL